MNKIVMGFFVFFWLALAVILPAGAQEISLEGAGLLHNQAVIYAREGDFAKSLQLLSETLKKDEGDLRLTLDYIVVLSWAGQCREAINNYEALPADSPLPDYVLPEIAKCYRISGQFEKAASLYKKILQSKPGEQDAIRGLVYTFLDAGKLESAYQLIQEAIEKDLSQGGWLQLLLADCLVTENRTKEAESIYAKALRDAPGNLHAQLGICRVSIIQKDYPQAAAILKVILEKDPKNIEALFCKGALLEAQHEYLKAWQLYEDILRIYPQSRIAKNLKYRALMDLGCNSLVREKLKETNDAVDPEIYQMLLGNEAMVRIWWEEPDLALKDIDRNLAFAKSAIAGIPVGKNSLLSRSYQDRILALRQKEEMYDIEREAAMLKELSLGTAPWVRTSNADAKLYLRKPEEALKIYRDALAGGWDPQQGNTRMAIYYTDIELGRYKAAEEILDALDKELPEQIVERGELRDNLRKEEVALSRGWSLAYQDRLAEANRYAEDLLSRAPYNSGIRSLLAQIYLWRGWPRRALEEFSIVRNIDPKDIVGQIGYSYALNENDQGEAARRLAKELLAKYPRNLHVQRLNRYFEIADMRTVTLNAAYTAEDPGVSGVEWSTRYEQPLLPFRKLFAEYVWRSLKEDEFEDNTRRGMVGLDWRLNHDWWYLGSVSVDENGSNFGYASQLTYNPNDYLSLSALYDSYSLNVPLRARVTGVDATEGGFAARFRPNENFESELRGSLFKFSDGNEYRAFNLRLDQAVTTAAYWKTRLALEGYAGHYSETEVDYYSPASVYSLYLVPMVEHTWFRRYERAMVDRLYLAPGKQWQNKFGSKDVWYARYEQDWRFSDTLGFLVGTIFSRRYYDAEATDAWNIYLTLKNNF